MIIKVKTKPESKVQEIEKEKDSFYYVKLKSRPKNNKANLELLRLLKKHFKKKARIIHGIHSKEKIIELEDS